MIWATGRRYGIGVVAAAYGHRSFSEVGGEFGKLRISRMLGRRERVYEEATVDTSNPAETGR